LAINVSLQLSSDFAIFENGALHAFWLFGKNPGIILFPSSEVVDVENSKQLSFNNDFSEFIASGFIQQYLTESNFVQVPRLSFSGFVVDSGVQLFLPSANSPNWLLPIPDWVAARFPDWGHPRA